MFKKTVSIMLFLLLVASAASARIINKINMPETLTFDNITLGLNGGGTRMEFIIKAYVAGLYLQKPMTDPQKIIDVNEPMAIRMHVTTRMATSKRMQRALYKGFRGTMPRGDVTPIKDKIKQFNACFSEEVVSGQILDVVYIPNKGTSVYRDGVLKGTVPGYEFKKNVFAIWLGNRPASKKLKKGMVAGDFRVDIAKITIARTAQEAKAKAEAAAKVKAEKAAQLAATEQAKAEAAARMQAAREAKVQAEAAAQAKVEKAAQLAAAQQAKAEAAIQAKAQKAAHMKAAALAKAREEAKVVAEAEKRTAQAKALEARAKKAALAPKPATSVTEAQVVGEDIFFGFNSAKLSAKAEKILAKKVEWLKANPYKKVSLQIFCDPSGSKLYNEYLAGKRAKSVVKGLTAAGISKDRIEILNFEFAKSRRAHFTVK